MRPTIGSRSAPCGEPFCIFSFGHYQSISAENTDRPIYYVDDRYLTKQCYTPYLSSEGGIFMPSLATTQIQQSRSRDAGEIVRAKWQELGEAEKAKLLPELLNDIKSWHGWSLNDSTRLDWLERQFKLAGIPFRSGR